MKKKIAFTLAEVLITLAILGVVAAFIIPSVISNTKEKEYKTELLKAISSLNQAIVLNIARVGESPYETKDLFQYFVNSMIVMKSTTSMTSGGADNYAFYTVDGTKFEIPHDNNIVLKLHDNDLIYAHGNNGECGSLGLSNNKDLTVKPPCIIMVDVNGDRKPNPDINNNTAGYDYTKTDGPVKDVFSILITDKAAIPYGVAAQKIFYGSDKLIYGN